MIPVKKLSNFICIPNDNHGLAKFRIYKKKIVLIK